MGGKCPIETTLSLINGKWKLLILKELSRGAVRYGRLGAAIPAVSAKVLTQQLRELEENGLIVRTVYAEVPPRVESSLSDMGASIFSVFKELRRWGLEDDGLARGNAPSAGSASLFTAGRKARRRSGRNSLPGGVLLPRFVIFPLR